LWPFAVLLVLLSWPSDPFGKHRFQDERRSSQWIARQMGRSIRLFYREYSRWPWSFDPGLADAGLLRTDTLVTGILLGTGPDNPKKIKFLPDLRTVAERGQVGFKSQPAGGASVVDAYGEEFYIVVQCPDKGDAAPFDAVNPEDGIEQGVGVYSAGPDKDPTTWEDNITSWESNSRNR